MASSRPKRTRKIVNYGEDHLHWIEEAQLQKAFLRSLHEKESPSKNNARSKIISTEKDSTLPQNLKSTSKQRRSSSPNQISKSTIPPKMNMNDFEKIMHDHDHPSNTNSIFGQSQEQPSTSSRNSKLKTEDNCDLRLTRLQSKLLEQAGMYYPDAEIALASITETIKEYTAKPIEHKAKKSIATTKRKMSMKCQLSDDEECPLTPRVRAQRKFASNTSPPRTRSNSPVKMHRQKLIFDDFNNKRHMKRKNRVSVRGRAVRACSSESEKSDSTSLDEVKCKSKHGKTNKIGSKSTSASLFPRPLKTDDFLSYLCFRNTTVKVELKDCMHSQ